MSNNTLVGRLLIVFVLALALIPGVLAGSTTISGGATVTGTGSAGTLISNYAGTSATSSTTFGSLDANYGISDTAGKQVNVECHVPYADSITYKFSSSNKASATIIWPTLFATQTFSVKNAMNYNNYAVTATATAQNAEGDKSTVYLYGYDYYYNNMPVTLTNVVQTASAYSTGVNTKESIESASSGYDFNTYTQSQNAKGYNTEVQFDNWWNGNGGVTFKGLSITSTAQKTYAQATGTISSVVVPVGAQAYFGSYAWNGMSGANNYGQIYNQATSKTVKDVAMTAMSGFAVSKATLNPTMSSTNSRPVMMG